MAQYILKRLLLMIPTLIGILFINFTILQFVPGGPIDTFKARIAGEEDFTGLGAVSTQRAEDLSGDNTADQIAIDKFKAEYGLDKPFFQRFGIMMTKYARFDFGYPMFKNKNISVLDQIKQRLPVSIALGLWSTLIIYLISIPLGIAKAVRDGTKFDTYSSAIIILAYALPSIILPVMLRMYFSGGADWGYFPLRGLQHEDYDSFTAWGKFKDYVWHVTLPVISMTVAGFATKTLLTKNSFLDEIKKQYVMTARAKGLSEGRILYGHVFRNAMLIIISGFPAIFIAVFFTGSFIVEQTFSLQGLGLLGLEAVFERDYPIIMGTLFIFSLIGLAVHLLADLTYILVDPRIDFEARNS